MVIHKKRNVHGFLLLDKPKGVSSNNILQKIKKVFYAKKAGYIGTLDPLATGILPICFGKCTKLSHDLNQFDKKYSVIAKFGETTSTADSEGILLKKRSVFFTFSDLENALQKLTGSINQIPPMYSAIKYNGIPLYKYARKGLNISRNSRKVFIHNFYFIAQKKNLVKLEVHCSKGTYIRTLIEDLGEILNCGAHVIALRRLQVGLFPFNRLVSASYLFNIMSKKKIYDLDFFKKIDSFLISAKNIVSFFPKIYLSTKELSFFVSGKKIHIISEIKNSLVQVFSKKSGYFISLGKIIFNKKVLILHRFISIIN
ncbi:tRNA pseudouridine(55) synthase TruB [Buchnera aphidicola (Melanaphis sacchari)]|uniref:tRNA pseudouridine synthase B n=1 Tax=Buchnera aphidicola (Melanaphis sacchari) TaxID=2173854 RepID=A0A2U8DF18_9GAMM|nr:tRNA pseudouridine(55) synthase TruB [Buchnera aphidicola]AWH90420.1 tRNA pseudouridine(55) synthase TruB [Buchnera aphidicola (Melanaphis sacchari)]